MHSKFLEVLSHVLGAVYFTSWSLSFYPQAILNWKRKAVTGLSFDFLILNVTGYVCYSTYTLAFLLSDRVQDEYKAGHTGPIPVDPSDAAFAVHGLLLTMITIGQCFIYERGDQIPSMASVSIVVAMWLSIIGTCVAAAFGALAWLDFVYGLSYLKRAVTLCKYIPQAYLNYQRKSTMGWSIGNVLLDLNGGFWSFAQQGVDAIDDGSLSIFTGNLVKLGLSILTVCFDSFFIVQHYCLYPQPKDKATKHLIEEVPDLEGHDSLHDD